MLMKEVKEIGQTKDVGFQVGVRKTFPVSAEKAWEYLFSDEGLTIWLGKLKSGDFEITQAYQTTDGKEGVIKVFKELSHIRLTWKEKEWTNVSTVQIRVINAKDKTTISFHQEKLLYSKQRKEMKRYWDNVIEKLAKQFSN